MSKILNITLLNHNMRLSGQLAEELTQRGAAIKFAFGFQSNENAQLWYSNDVHPDTIIEKMEQMLTSLKIAQAKKKKQ